MDIIKQFILNEIKEKRMDVPTGMDAIGKLSKSAAVDEPIAIIGMAQRLPQADTLREFRQNLLNKIDSVRPFPDKRREVVDQWLPDAFCETEDPYQKQGYLDDISLFDESFFELSVAEAKNLHPIQRLFMMCAYEALEDAGYGGKSLGDTKTAIYVGNAQLGERRYKDFSSELDGTGFIGSANSMVPSRIAYYLGLNGPGMIVDSACSSGLLGVHMACESLKNKHVDCAIACGAAINLMPLETEKITIMESPNSVVSPFDEKANGTVWGEGIGVVILKRASEAIVSGDHIYALIKGSGVNNNGASSSLTALDANAQQKLFESIWKKHHINPGDIVYVEAHGTGTEIGDAIEVKSLSKAFAAFTSQKQFCALGTSKGNIGHIIGASGTAALIKVAQSFHSGEIPPMQRFDYPNKYIDFSQSALYVADQKIIIEKNDKEPLIAINSFGINGTNVHMVLSKPEENTALGDQEHRLPLFISAKNPESLFNLIEKYVAYLADSESSLEDICYTAWIGRGYYKCRAAAIAYSKADLRSKLSTLYTAIVAGEAYSQDTYYFEGNKTYQPSDEMSACCINYVMGKVVNAQSFFSSRAKRTSIPTYPFCLKRRWVDPPSVKPMHPVTGRAVLIGDNEEFYDIALDVRGWRMNEYAIDGRKVLPASALIEIIYQMACEYYSDESICISNLQFYDPVYGDSFTHLKAVLFKNQSRMHMELYGVHDSQTNNKLILAQAYISSVSVYPENITPNYFFATQWPDIQGQSGRWNCMERFTAKGGEFTFDVGLPKQYHADMKTHQLHPALLDVATTAMFIFAYGDCVPVGGQEIYLYRPLPPQFTVTAKEISGQEGAAYDITLLDSAGIIASIKRYQLKKADGASDIADHSLNALTAIGQNKLTGYKESAYSIYEKALAAVWCEVLGCSSVDLDNDYFSLGGDSIMAITIANKLSDGAHHRIEAMDMFQYSTIRQLGEFLQKEQDPKAVLEVAPKREAYPLSKEQQDIYVYSVLNPQSTVYNLSTVLEMSGEIDIRRIEKAFYQIIEENESFRTRYMVTEENSEQIICSADNYTMSVQYMDHPLDTDELELQIKKFNRPFDLQSGILLRTWLIKDGDNHGYLFIGTHHIAADGRSMTILLEDFIGLYTDGITREKKRKYIDYAEFSAANNILDHEEECKYWRSKFSGEIPKLDLPIDFERSSNIGDRGGVSECILSADTVEALKEQASQLGVTVSSLMMSAFSIMLFKYSGQEDIVVGMPYAGRQYRGLENVIGMFVHTLPVRVQATASMRIADFVQLVHQDCLSSMKNASFHTGELPKVLELKSDASRGSLYNVMFTFQNTGGRIEITDVVSPRIELSLDGIQVKSIDFDRGVARSDLMLEIVERNREYVCFFEYSSGLFRETTVKRMAKCLQRVVAQMLNNPQAEIKTLDVISDEERKRILHEFSGPVVEIPESMGVVPAFQEMVARYPGKTALISDDACYSYLSLDGLSNKIMVILATKGVGEEDSVIIYLRRSPLLIASILGVWKRGASYIPVDVDYPIERINRVQETSSAKYIVTLRENITPELDQEFGEQLLILDEELAAYDERKENSAIVQYEGDRLAYTIFTSGSTGTPKGAMIDHAGMINHIMAKIHELDMRADTVIAANASPCFDISVWQFFSALCIGGTVVVFSESDITDITAFMHKTISCKINILEITPGYLVIMLDALTDRAAALEQLRYLVVTGDVVDVSLVNRWLDMFPNTPVVNAYGPTEAADDITHCVISQKLVTKTVPVGKTLQNLHIYILNEGNQLCPIGVRGEICVSGIGVGRGYMNNPEQTERAFGMDPFAPEPRRMYRTGDIGCWLDDGTLKIFGRKDHQIKIRGFRIELNEITTNIISCPGICEAVTVVLGDADHKYLCSYYTAGTGPMDDIILSTLKERLPDYMIPTVLVFLEEMPHNDNGKIDRKLLPIPQQPLSNEKLLMPVSKVQKAVCRALEKVLGATEVGLNQNFFNLGGDSIKAIQFSAKLRQEGYTIDIQNIFSADTIAELIPYVSEISNEEGESLTGDFELSYLQGKYIDVHDLYRTYWNQNIALTTHFSVDEKVVYDALLHVVQGHDSLRMHFTHTGGTYMQEYSREADESLQVMRVDIENSYEQLDKQIKQFNTLIQLETGKNIGCLIVHTENETMLFFAVNHLLVDPMSFRIIIEDFFAAYHKISAGLAPERILKTSSYKKYIERTNELFSIDMTCDHYKFYEQYYKKHKPHAIFEKDDSVCYSDAQEVVLEISGTLSSQLGGPANAAYGTDLEILLASGLALAMRQVFGTDCGCIFMESDLRFADLPSVALSHSVGWFAAEYPVIFDLHGSVEDAIICIKENIRLTPWNGACYGFAADRLATNGHVFPADVLFNYMGNFDPTGSGDGYELSAALSGVTIGKSAHMEYGMEVNAGILENKIRFNFVYNPKALHTESVGALQEALVNSLEQIDTFCCAQDKVISTPSDYNNSYITRDDLQHIEAYVRDVIGA